MNERQKHIWLTDTHLWPWNRHKFLNIIYDHRPRGVFLTGDISNSAFMTLNILEYLGAKIGRPLYFVLGNHDLHLSSLTNVHSEVKRLCQKYPNLVWMEDVDFAPINEQACVIGTDNWYDARIGNVNYLKYTFDWFLTKEFRDLPDMKTRIEKFRDLAQASTTKLLNKLEKVIDEYKTIYVLMHVPCFPEAHRSDSWLSYKFYEPYNVNLEMGNKLRAFMEQHKKRHLVILSGHVHAAQVVYNRGIECRVGKGSYTSISEEEILYI